MNKEGGFIKIYRSMLQWEWHDEPLTVATWHYCLLRANWEKTRWHGEVIDQGQFITSLKHMAKDIGITVSQLRTSIKHLKSTHNIASQSTSKGTLITVVNYGLYQSAGDKMTSQMTSTLASQSQANDKPIATDKEYKEYKEIKEERENREKGIKVKDPVILSYKESASIMQSAHEAFKEAMG